MNMVKPFPLLVFGLEDFVHTRAETISQLISRKLHFLLVAQQWTHPLTALGGEAIKRYPVAQHVS